MKSIEICLPAEGFSSPGSVVDRPLGVLRVGWTVVAGKKGVGPKSGETHALSRPPQLWLKPYMSDTALMIPPETETVWLLHDRMHCRVYNPCFIRGEDCIGRAS